MRIVTDVTDEIAVMDVIVEMVVTDVNCNNLRRFFYLVKYLRVSAK